MVRVLTSYSNASSRALRRRGAQARSSSTSAYSRSVRFTCRPYDLAPTNWSGRGLRQVTTPSDPVFRIADSGTLIAVSSARIPARSRVAGARCRAPAPSEPCVPLVAAHGSGKPRGRRGLGCGFPALAGMECPLAGCVYEASLVTVGGAGPPVVGEVAGRYRPAGDLQPPSFPLLGGLGWLVRR